MSYASLPMYMFEQNRAQWHALYAYLSEAWRAEGLQPPPQLVEGGDVPALGDVNCFFTMTCGAPFRNQLKDKVELLGVLDFFAHRRSGYYHSVILASPHFAKERDEGVISAQRVAVNDMNSQSGFHALFHEFPSLVRGAEIVKTGAHIASMEALLQNEADIAAIDVVTWEILCGTSSKFQALNIIARSTDTPALPFVASASEDNEKKRACLHKAITEAPKHILEPLGIRGIVDVDVSDYLRIPDAQI